MKISLIIVLGCSFILLGSNVKNHYRQRSNFYDCLAKFLIVLNQEITFLKSDLACIMNSHHFSDDFDCFLKEYLSNQKVTLSFLSDEENNQLLQFLNSLGKGDVEREVNNLSYYSVQFNDKLAKVKQDESTNGNMYFKLVSLIGVVICIMLI
ncbi:MAG: stage III sporulation protein AB [Clostridia bacterium]|nr:stage III sporulation protein AB [Clostridia bacterium]